MIRPNNNSKYVNIKSKKLMTRIVPIMGITKWKKNMNQCNLNSILIKVYLLMKINKKQSMFTRLKLLELFLVKNRLKCTANINILYMIRTRRRPREDTNVFFVKCRFLIQEIKMYLQTPQKRKNNYIWKSSKLEVAEESLPKMNQSQIRQKVE